MIFDVLKPNETTFNFKFAKDDLIIELRVFKISFIMNNKNEKIIIIIIFFSNYHIFSNYHKFQQFSISKGVLCLIVIARSP